MAVNHDTFVNVNLIDESVIPPDPDPTPVGFSFLQPFFSKKGLDNVIKRFSGSGTFVREYGNDVDSTNKYGHGGLIAREILSGGGVVDACRLMPQDAKIASVVVGIAIGDHDDKKYVRIVSKQFDFTKSVDLNMVTYMIDAAGDVITEIPSNGSTEAPTYYTVYPLIIAKAKGRGTYGNEFGIKIELDTSREGRVKDGRRYAVRFFEGSNILGDSFEFVSASFNPAAVAVPGSDIPDSYDIVFERFARIFRLPVDSYYSSENFESIVDELKSHAGLTPSLEEEEKYMIDIFQGIATKDQDYDDIVFESPAASKGIIKFSGGDDGDIFSNEVITEGPNAGKKKKDVVREDLLVAFYSGNIDKNLFDQRIIDAGVTLDAWWPTKVKETMAGIFGQEVRDDIFAYLDLGEGIYDRTTAETAAKGLAASISHPYGSVAINIHNGTTRNRIRNIRTSGNYEIASALPTLYRVQGPFTIHAGYISGRVRNMDFDFYPKVVKDDLEIAPLREAKLIFAMKLDRSDDFFFMSDDSQYNTDFSVLGSTRNLIYAGEVMRTVRKVLVKYSFHPDSAEVAISQATEELNTIFSGRWFPSNLPISFNIFQTRNDKINKTASVSLAIQFPDVVETWKVTITANRQPLE